MSIDLKDNDCKYVSLIDIRPGTRRTAVRGVIIELLSDPPQSTTIIRERRYHYRLADATASVELAIPHGVLQDIVSKNFNTLGVIPGYNADHVDSVVFPAVSPHINVNILHKEYNASGLMDDGSGFTWKGTEGITMNFVHGEMRNIGAEYAEDSDWSGWSEDEHEESLKWLMQPGDVISMTVAAVWLHGRLIIVPDAGCKQLPLKIGRLATNFKLEPDISKQYTSP